MGALILTTPKRSAEWIIALYARDIEDEHVTFTIPATPSKRWQAIGSSRATRSHFAQAWNQVFIWFGSIGARMGERATKIKSRKTTALLAISFAALGAGLWQVPVNHDSAI